MHAHKRDITVPADRRIFLDLPDDFPPGPAEVIVLAAPRHGRSVARLGGALGAAPTPPPGTDIIADALDQLRRDRREHIEELAEELAGRRRG